MKIWIQTSESLKEYEVETLLEAQEKIIEMSKVTTVISWDISSFRAPPAEPEGAQEFNFVSF